MYLHTHTSNKQICDRGDTCVSPALNRVKGHWRGQTKPGSNLSWALGVCCLLTAGGEGCLEKEEEYVRRVLCAVAGDDRPHHGLLLHRLRTHRPDDQDPSVFDPWRTLALQLYGGNQDAL